MDRAKTIHLIGLAGPTSSGKTTLLTSLKQAGLKFSSLSFDEYDLYPSGSRSLKRLLSKKKIKYWESPRLFDYRSYVSHLQMLKKNRKVKLKTRSRDSVLQKRRKQVVLPKQIMIVEGICIFSSPKARNLFSLMIFIDLPEKEIVKRRLKRTKNHVDPWDNIEYIKGPMIEGTRKYVYSQKRHAHVILNGLRTQKQLSKEILKEIDKKINAS